MGIIALKTAFCDRINFKNLKSVVIESLRKDKLILYQ